MELTIDDLYWGTGVRHPSTCLGGCIAWALARPPLWDTLAIRR